MQYGLNRGYTLLLAVIVSSVVLSVAAFIVSISRKQFILSSTARDSTIAIYAADSGVQCAVRAYTTGYDLSVNNGAFKSYCNDREQSYNFSSNANSTEIADMNFKDGIAKKASLLLEMGNACANVTIYDGINSATNGHMTIIESRGYNSYSPSSPTVCPKPGPRVTERAIRVIYND